MQFGELLLRNSHIGDDVMTKRRFLQHWPFVKGIRDHTNDQYCRASVFLRFQSNKLICVTLDIFEYVVFFSQKCFYHFHHVVFLLKSGFISVIMWPVFSRVFSSESFHPRASLNVLTVVIVWISNTSRPEQNGRHLQMTFWIEFSTKKMTIFLFKFCWKLLLGFNWQVFSCVNLMVLCRTRAEPSTDLYTMPELSE